MHLERLGIKVFAEESGTVALTDLIPIFHRWIQQHLLDELLIDVADYSHVIGGPGTMLIAHEGNYAYDETELRRGLLYYSKRGLPAGLAGLVETVGRRALSACRMLEQEPALGGRLKFPGGSMQIITNDRLNAPANTHTFGAVEPAVRAFLDRVYGGVEYQLEPVYEAKERFRIEVRADAAPGVEAMLARL